MLDKNKCALLILCSIEIIFAKTTRAGVSEDLEKREAVKKAAIDKCKLDPKGDICVDLAYQYDLGNFEGENSNYLSVDLLKISCEKKNPMGCEKLKSFSVNNKNALDCYLDYETGEKCYSQALIHLKHYKSSRNQDELRYARYYLKAACQRNHKKGCDENEKLNGSLNRLNDVYSSSKSAITLSGNNGKVSGVLIRGIIKKGDYDEFESTIKRYKGGLSAVYLDSPGGDALEAMKIGRLIRELHLETWAPGGSQRVPICFGQNQEDKGKFCTCLSSCVLIFLSGVKRYGDVLGVHRIYPNHELLRSFSAEEAKKLHELIKIGATKYFADLEAPQELLNMLLSIPSNDIKYLDGSEISKFIPRLIPEYQEWVLAKCGDSKALDEKERKWLNNHKSKFRKDMTIGDVKSEFPEYKKISLEIDEAYNCERSLLEKLRKDAYSKKYGKL